MEKTEKKSRLILYLLGGMIILVSVYVVLQYVSFTKQYERNFLKTTSLLEKSFKNILESYKVVLLEFSKEIKKKNLFLESVKLSELFEKSYTYGSGDANGAKIHLSSINWVGKGDTPTVGRFGPLLYKLEFSPEYLERLKRSPGKLEISNVIPEAGNSEPPLTNLGIGVDDEKEVYRGFVNARIQPQTLLESLSGLENEDKVRVVLLDQKAQVLASSLDLSADAKKELSQILKKQGKGCFSKVDHVFAKNVPLNEYPYSLLFGYPSEDFYIKFFDYLFPQILCIIVISLFIIFFSYVYYLKRLKDGWRVLRKKNGKLRHSNDKLNEKTYQLMDAKKELEEERDCREEGLREEKKFLLDVNRRSSEATSDLLNVGNALLERVKFQEELDEDPQEVMDIFENSYLHGCFVCRKTKNDPTDIASLLDESLKIHAHTLSKNKIQLVKTIDKNIKIIITDSISLKQALINILGKALEQLPTEGKIEISLFDKKETVHIEFKDNGYEAEDLKKTKAAVREEKSSLDSMFLEWHDLQKLVRSLGGRLSYNHQPYQGNHFAFQLPQQFHKPPIHKEEIILPKSDNIIPFSSLKRNEKT